MTFARRWKRRHPTCAFCGERLRARAKRIKLLVCESCLSSMPIHTLDVREAVELLANGCDCPGCLGTVVCEAGDQACPA